jgi:hypothetical protein
MCKVDIIFCKLKYMINRAQNLDINRTQQVELALLSNMK